MIFSAIILSIVMPLQIAMKNPKFEPFIVQATLDAAVIAGIPASRSAKNMHCKRKNPTS
jgi:hypothetical protein